MYCIVLDGMLVYCMLLHYRVLSCGVLYDNILYGVDVKYAVWCYDVLC